MLEHRFPTLRAARLRLHDAGPTPVRPLRAGGEQVWVKEDGRFGRRYGGNKARKLEWTLADARERGYRTVLTFGAIGTNHGLATAIYAREAGLRCAVATVEQPRTPQVEAQHRRLHDTADRVHDLGSSRRVKLAAPYLLARHLTVAARRPLPYVLPTGGSSPLGAFGYVDAALELGEQVRRGELPAPATVVCACGTGGTAAGLAVGLPLAGLAQTTVLTVVVNDLLRLDEESIGRLAARTARLLARRGASLPAGFAPAPLRVERAFLGGGYGVATQEGDEAQRAAAERDDLPLDPVYTAKALAAVRAVDLPRPALFLATKDAAQGPSTPG